MNRRDFIKSATVMVVAPAAVSCSGPEIKVIDGLPVSKFNKESTAEEVTEGLDLAGKIAVVTGCNSGIGYETMRVLALRGAHVIGTGRSMDKAGSACERVAGMATPVVLELSDYQSVMDCARTITGLVPHIDILVANAGMIAGAELEQVNGIEKTFAVNHLGHFVFVNNLLAKLKAAQRGRVVMVSSRAAFGSEGIEFDNLSGEKDYHRRKAYSHSKLANALFSLELARRLQSSTVTSNALHPGVIRTNIARNEPWYIRMLFSLGSPFYKTTEQGAATSCYVATAPVLSEVSGYFFMDCNPVELSGPAHLYNYGMAEKLWQVSEELTVNYLP